MKKDDDKFNRDIFTITTDEELERQEKEINDSCIKIIETLDGQLDNDDDSSNAN